MLRVGRIFDDALLLQGGVSDEVTLSAYITAALLELGVQTSVSKPLLMSPKGWTLVVTDHSNSIQIM